MMEGRDAGPIAEDPPVSTMKPVAAQVDVAHEFREQVFLYGWIFGLSRCVASAQIQYGDTLHDVLACAIRVPRPDVTRHFDAKGTAGDDGHGFYLLAPANRTPGEKYSLTLQVMLHTGETLESVWPVGRGELAFLKLWQQELGTFNWLLSHLKPAEAAPLQELVATASHVARDVAGTAAAVLPFQFEVDLCCVLEDRILLILGWLVDPEGALQAADVRIDEVAYDFLGGLEFTSRPDIDSKMAAHHGEGTVRRFGFTFIAQIPPAASPCEEIAFNFQTGSGQSRLLRPVTTVPAKARDELADLLDRLDGDAAIALIERIASRLAAAPPCGVMRDFLDFHHRRAVERLPGSLESSNPRILLHIDRVVAIAEQGIFLNGWFNAEDDASPAVACHCGFTQLDIGELWTRHARLDVAAHLIKIGVSAGDNDHGFACYAPLKNQGIPYYISVTPVDGAVRRLRIPTPTAKFSALQCVREVLGSFTVGHRSLRTLLDRHIGPAVQIAWAGRGKTHPTLVAQRFGAEAAESPLSIIVPLYGRFDFAEYQLAMFAGDPDFDRFELIYFVDDPAIYDEFIGQCADLFAMYQVPFTVAFCGANLGFAGANNRAAGLARGRHLLLLNSDVFPKTSGWAAQMLKVYGTLDAPGLLGVKLLFEDGSVQHAGMAFRRHPPWSGLWINHHPHKGQSAEGLTGVQEVDAVTAACVLVDRRLYLDIGGLSEDYIVGDFEDSDLCLRIASAGRRNRVALDIEMYHLERQSQDRIGDAQWRTNLTVYNCWQHHQRWAGHIEKLQS